VIVALDHEARLHDDLFRSMLEELMIGRLAAGRLWTKDLEGAVSRRED